MTWPHSHDDLAWTYGGNPSGSRQGCEDETTASRSAHDELTPLRRRIADLEGENGRLRCEEEHHRGLFAAMTRLQSLSARLVQAGGSSNSTACASG